ncbi:TPA: hypothetical protein N0F65_006609 [Lagenidium giganteum]|uniref:non-specific serine/threonine protein kinase n=1 Tax=Lagenidium giganteum TaxID=4803 RepID=A0AAV2ZBS7_9STRA|nr:TPA: hypothetical protein N0F65_006609 [Lagenidium giganteum]
MMNERRRKLQTVKVDHYDGQAIFSHGELYYELGGYLGGGAAGVVYEAFCMRTKRHVAIKILNPVGYKLVPSTLLSRCVVAVRGKSPEPLVGTNNTAPLRSENVWWLVHPTTKQSIAAYECPRTGMLRELTLPQCMDIWGHEVHDQLQHAANVHNMADDPCGPGEFLEVQVKNQMLKIPRIPKKFIKFAHMRQSIHREISNMSGIGQHENVLRLEEALELVQDSKCTTFLVLELAAGGELFDRIKLDCGTNEATARRYFRQLVSGVAFCHACGICHRDLKPENLLLADNEENSTLKIADFGLSAIFSITDDLTGSVGDSNGNGNGNSTQAIRRLRSVVGSPHYVAPEVLMDTGQGYDGAKADAWSIGVILYAMIAGNLPFGKDLLKCLRYDKFRKWSYNTKYSDDDPAADDVFPPWFFPTHFSFEAKSLIAQLLYPDASMRMSVEESQRHAWVLHQSLKRNRCPLLSVDTSPSQPQDIPKSLDPSMSPASCVRSASVVLNVAQNVIEQEQWYKQRGSSAASPLSNSFSSRSGKSPRQPTTMGMSPQKPPGGRSLHLMSSYMPPVDETTAMSGQTPPSSPRVGSRQCLLDGEEEECPPSPDALAADKTVPLQFDLEVADGSIEDSPSDLLIDEEVLSPSVESTSSREELHRRFTSPPLAIESRTGGFRHQHRRNSPPELLFTRFEKAIQLEQVKLDDSPTLSSSPATSSASPTTTSSPLLRGLGLNADGTAMAATNADPPSYQDTVARSTRFMTALPAQLVLSRIEAILLANPSPLPHPYKNVPQRLKLDWDMYQLEVRYGSVLTCSVQVFLYQRGVYLVEFRRGQLEIFQFKRFYENIREKISACIESKDNARVLTSFRKRNKSICMPHEGL